MDKQTVFDTIVRAAREIIPELEVVEVSGNEEFEDLGANSADRADIIALTLESLALDIPRVAAFGPKTINGLADLLYGKLSHA